LILDKSCNDTGLAALGAKVNAGIP
jgi:hypothetical protein